MSDTLAEGTGLKHAPYGPSQAEGYTTCLDYVNANAGLPDVTLEVAAEGTVAHGISDLCLLLGMEPHDFIGTTTSFPPWQFEWTEDDADLLLPGIEQIRSYGGEFYGEFRVDVSPWTMPGQFGTLDRAVVVWIDGELWVIVVDLKWGRHVAVVPQHNKQIVLYALGFWETVKHRFPGATPRFLLGIDQPRCAGGGGEWRTTLAELQEIGAWIKSRVELGQQPNPPRTASLKGCMWCRRRRAPGGCLEFETYGLGVLGLDFNLIDESRAMAVLPPLPDGMSPERRAFIVRHRSMIVKWLELLEEQHLADTLAGRPAGELKAVEGKKGRDVWHSKQAAIDKILEVVGDAGLAPPAPKTPLQLSKVITPEQAKLIDPLIKRGEKKPILVPLDDARPALVSGQADFDEEEGS